MSRPGKYDFSGKVALISGSSSGIGAAIALQLAQYNAQLTITGRDEKALEEVAKQIESISGKAPLQLVGDLLDSQFVPKLVTETITRFGRLDYLVNNAGAPSHDESFDTPKLMEVYDKVMALNVRAPLQLTQLACPFLEKSKGAIVNISSCASVLPWMLVYSTSKAALDMLTKTSAGLLAGKGIRVNSVNPGPTATRNGRFFATENYFVENEAALKAFTALGRVGKAEEIANVAVFLLSDDAVNMTGSIVLAEAGVMVKMN